ncbi:MAG TPA: hypothetical protein VLY23_01880 [Candidatus Acidoferrum sp.]|nr:hypothetical protein [Candidatus Acidoferrum sp.]
MAIVDLYSKRKKRQESQGKADVYQYDQIPEGLRIQVVKIWAAALGRWRPPSDTPFVRNSPSSGWWEYIERNVSTEKSMWNLGKPSSDPQTRCIEYLMGADTDGALDIIELSFKVLDLAIRKFGPGDCDDARITLDPDEAIEDLNHRFREHGVGYQYVNGIVVRVDSQFLHAEAVKPALALLDEVGFTGPADEFVRAFDHHRKGEKKDALADALSAFESTMKAICDARGWRYGPKDTAKPLLDLLFKNGLIPRELQTHFAGFRAAIEAGLPTVANPNRHGQGLKPVDVPEHFVAYALHLAASNIVFLVDCHKRLK